MRNQTPPRDIRHFVEAHNAFCALEKIPGPEGWEIGTNGAVKIPDNAIFGDRALMKIVCLPPYGEDFVEELDLTDGEPEVMHYIVEVKNGRIFQFHLENMSQEMYDAVVTNDDIATAIHSPRLDEFVETGAFEYATMEDFYEMEYETLKDRGHDDLAAVVASGSLWMPRA